MELRPLAFLWRYAYGVFLLVRCFCIASLDKVGKGVVGWAIMMAWS